MSHAGLLTNLSKSFGILRGAPRFECVAIEQDPVSQPGSGYPFEIFHVMLDTGEPAAVHGLDRACLERLPKTLPPGLQGDGFQKGSVVAKVLQDDPKRPLEEPISFLDRHHWWARAPIRATHHSDPEDMVGRYAVSRTLESYIEGKFDLLSDRRVLLVLPSVEGAIAVGLRKRIDLYPVSFFETESEEPHQFRAIFR